MEFNYVGEIVNTHGLKGELRLRSEMEHKDQVFVPGRILYVGKEKEPVTIVRYRKHKDYDMITLEGMEDINDVLPFKGEFVYLNHADLQNLHFYEDYIGLEAYVNNRYLGTIKSIQKSKAHDLFEVEGEHHYWVPKRPEFIESINFDLHRISFVEMAGLFDED